MRIGAHVRDDDPVGTAARLGAEVVQLFVTDPQAWKKPEPHPQAAALRAADLTVVVHSAYVINVASQNNRIRIPSRKAVLQQAHAAAELGAIGLVVHGGHVRAGEDAADGVASWRTMFARQADDGGFPVPILVENTAGGDHAMARHLDEVARLWDAIGEFGPGFVLDTCHAWAGGEALEGVVERARTITGRIDLVHLNSSRDGFDSGRDRHANLADGTVDADVLVQVCRDADAPVVLETPAEGVADDLAHLRGALRA